MKNIDPALLVVFATCAVTLAMIILAWSFSQ